MSNNEPYTTAQKIQAARIRARQESKRNLLYRSSMQAKAAKAELIRKEKGRNGVSMTKSLFDAHLALV